MKNLLIVGTGGQAKVVLDCAIETKKYNKISFLDKNTNEQSSILDFEILDESKISLEDLEKKFDEIIVAIGNNRIRLEKTNYFINKGMKLALLIHPSAIVSRFANIDIGSVVLANAVVNPFAKIGKACIINTASIVEHECIIKDGVHLSPKVAIGGNVCIGEESWICIGGNISNNINIGSNVIVGAGSVVLEDVVDNVLIAGIPAIIRKKYKE